MRYFISAKSERVLNILGQIAPLSLQNISDFSSCDNKNQKITNLVKLISGAKPGENFLVTSQKIFSQPLLLFMIPDQYYLYLIIRRTKK